MKVTVKYLKFYPDESRDVQMFGRNQGYYLGKTMGGRGRPNYETVDVVHITGGLAEKIDLEICEDIFADYQAGEFEMIRNIRSMNVGDFIVIERDGSEARAYIMKRDGWEEIQTNKKTVCRRCDGYGYIPSFPHIEAGVCFRCNGSGKAR